jgi:hypothetical protein
MTSLSQSYACPEGYSCPNGTTAASQFDNPCKPGYYCYSSTTPAEAFDYCCDEGFFCWEATAFSEKNRNTCNAGYFCPNCTSEALPLKTKCPEGTTSPRGSISLEDCVKVGQPDLALIAPFSAAAGDAASALESLAGVNGTVPLNPLQFVTITFDWSHFLDFFLLDEHWTLQISAGRQGSDSDLTLIDLPEGFTDPSVTKQQVVRFNMLATNYVDFQIRCSIVDGRFMELDTEFRDTMTIQIDEPRRAHPDPQTTFFVVLPRGDIEVPLNRPKDRWETVELVTEDPTLALSVGYTSVNESIPFIRPELDSLSASPEVFWGRELTMFALSTLPYFSNCRGFDSYIPLYRAMEDPDLCELVPDEDIVPVDPWLFWLPQNADTCDYTLQCIYEENTGIKEASYRWYEAPTGTKLWYFTSDPTNYETFLVGEEYFSTLIGTDKLVPCAVSRPPVIPEFSAPSSVVLGINYYQETKTTKRIITCDLELDGYEVTASPDEPLGYEMQIVVTPLEYFDLLNLFAFQLPLYIMLYVIISLGTLFSVALFWLVHRLLTRVKYPPPFRMFSYFRVASLPSLIGVLLMVLPSFVPFLFIYLAVAVFPIFDVLPGTYDQLYLMAMDPTFETTSDDGFLDKYRAGRVGTMSMVVGIYFIVLATRLLVPNVGDTNLKYSRTEWTPVVWRRLHPWFITIILMCWLTWIVEFSYGPWFSEYVYFILAALYFIRIMVEDVMDYYTRELLLLQPMLACYTLVEFVVTLGAATFVDFMVAFFVELWLDIFSRCYYDPIVRVKVNQGAAWLKFTILTKLHNRFPRVEAFRQNDTRTKKQHNNAEQIIDDIAGFSVEAMASILGPAMIGWIMLFQKELNLIDTYGIRNTDLVFYWAFAIFVVPTRAVYTLFIHNVQELLHGWKLFMYLRSSAERFRLRTIIWKGFEKHLDETKDDTYRTLDQMNFSSQYYFIASMYGWGAAVVVWSGQILVQQEYYPFDDPFFLFYTIVMCLLCTSVWVLLFGFIRLIRMWKPKYYGYDKFTKQVGEEEDEEEEDHFVQFLEEKRKNDEEFIDPANFHHEFMTNNRTWLMRQFYTDDDELDQEDPSLTDWNEDEISFSTRRIAKKWLAKARKTRQQTIEETDVATAMWALYKSSVLEQEEPDEGMDITSWAPEPIPEFVRPIALRWLGWAREKIEIRRMLANYKEPVVEKVVHIPAPPPVPVAKAKPKPLPLASVADTLLAQRTQAKKKQKAPAKLKVLSHSMSGFRKPPALQKVPGPLPGGSSQPAAPPPVEAATPVKNEELDDIFSKFLQDDEGAAADGAASPVKVEEPTAAEQANMLAMLADDTRSEEDFQL